MIREDRQDRRTRSPPEARHPGRGGRGLYLSGFAADGEVRSRPRVTVAGPPTGATRAPSQRLRLHDRFTSSA